MNDTQKLAFIIECLTESYKKYNDASCSDGLKGFFLHSEINAILVLAETWEKQQ